MRQSRREFVRTGVAALASASTALARPALAQSSPGVVVIGGGFGGAASARALRRIDANIRVTLVEPQREYVTCPGSNAVIAGLAEERSLRFGYDGVAKTGVSIVHASATSVDPRNRAVRLADGASLVYDRLIVAPGIDMRWNVIPGYGQAAAKLAPHAWSGDEQISLLRQQIAAMDDGGTVAISVADNPLRCPVAPYERASLIAHYLKAKKPKSKVIVLDAKESFTKQRLFQEGWARLYPGMLEWVPLSRGGNVVSVDAKRGILETDFDRVNANVINVIPPQQAGTIARIARVADRTGWCPVDPRTFESTLVPYVHVVGDAAISGAIPKSAHGARAQGEACAAVVAALLAGKSPPEPKLDNICTSLVAPDYGISIWGAYRPGKDVMVEIEGSAGTSPLDAPAARRAHEAQRAAAWFGKITGDLYG